MEQGALDVGRRAALWAALTLVGGPALADPLPAAPPDAVDAASPVPPPPPPAKRPSRFLVHVNFGVNVYTLLAATAKAPLTHVSLGDRVTLLEMAGFGYAIHPKVRLQLAVQFGETVAGAAPGNNPFTLFGVIPWVVFTQAGFLVGTGPLILARAGGTDTPDFGFAVIGGYAHPIGHGFSLGGTVQVPVLLLIRPSIAVIPTVLFAYRF